MQRGNHGMKRLIVYAASLALSVSSASAAMLNGEAMVRRSQGFNPQAGGELRPGDTVMVRQGTSATITFTDGCVYTLLPGQVLTISGTSPCTPFTQSVRTIDFSGRMGDGVNAPRTG